MTLQKVAPLVLVSYAIIGPTASLIIQVSSILSALAGAVGGLNQTLLRKILAYSSINHMGWILAAVSLRIDLWLTYILVYATISSSIVLVLNTNQIFHFKQIASIPQTKTKVLSFIALFSLGGLPPFLGFVPKLLIIRLLSSLREAV